MAHMLTLVSLVGMAGAMFAGCCAFAAVGVRS